MIFSLESINFVSDCSFLNANKLFRTCMIKESLLDLVKNDGAFKNIGQLLAHTAIILFSIHTSASAISSTSTTSILNTWPLPDNNNMFKTVRTYR